MKLEVVVIPSDVDRAKKFHARLGPRLDADFAFDNDCDVIIGDARERLGFRL